MELKVTMNLPVVDIYELRYWEEPVRITDKTIIAVCDDLGAAMDYYAVNWRDNALEESMQRMKLFIDNAKRKIAAKQPKDAGAVVSYISRTIDLFNKVSRQNALDWNDLRVKGPHAVFKGGPKRG